MDFHSLSRRDLQALCKRNKIPANMTNLAMADALQALQTVEGLEEVLAHSEIDSLDTPAKSMAATPSVYGASNRQRTVKVETETSKLTRTRRGTRKDIPETAPPSACVKFSVAQSTNKNAENSTVQQAYSTRRSTRLLEKKMCQLSLKENEDMADAKAILEKDSQDMQRQFSEDMDNSLVDKTFSDESNITKEATEEPNQEPFEPSMKLNDNAGDLENLINEVEEFINEVEESINDKDCKDADEDQPMQEDVVGQLDGISDELEKTQHNVNGVDAAQDEVLESITMIEDESVLGSESKATEIAITPVCQPMEKVILGSEFKATENAIAADDETQKGIEETVSGDISCDTVMEDDDNDSDEFGFLSEASDDDSEISNEEVNQAVVEPLLDGDNMVCSFGNNKKISESAEEECIPKQSSSKKSASAHQVVHNSDNKEERFEISARNTLLQNENIAATATGTPFEKKSLRQLKKMVKARKQQKAEEKRPTPLQVHADNV